MGKQKEGADSGLFLEAMQGVTPLQQDKVPLTQTRPSAIPKQYYLNKASIYDEMLSDSYYTSECDTDNDLLFVRPGIQHGILNKLKRGSFNIEADLDLHGMIVRTARIEVIKFLQNCQDCNIRCARIVHGKGYGSWNNQPVLKGKLNRWLRQCPEVLAFCSARPSDGGTGALYLLLKRH
ncbi:MAG: Smr/MutS family protein [Thiomargarita sp.]|nr:Smr/MutS family protein [Thiomargarita sp.]